MAKIAAFHTSGSNLIKVDVYSEDELDTVVTLLNNNAEQESIIIPGDLYNEGKAFVVFNYLTYSPETYRIRCVENNVVSECSVNVIESPNSEHSNLMSEEFSDKANPPITEMETETDTEEMQDTTLLEVDFNSPELNKVGDNKVSYIGGGNRFITNTEGLLIKQKNTCHDINDKYSPLSLNTFFKCEDEATNYFSSWTHNQDVITGNETVQTGIVANSYRNRGGFDYNKITLTTTANVEVSYFNPSVCFSSLLRSSIPCKATLSILDGDTVLSSEVVDLDKQYNMMGIVTNVEEPTLLTFKIEVVTNNVVTIYSLMTQIENYFCPTSRILAGQNRQKDELKIEASSLYNVICMGDDECEPLGGFVEIEFVSSRNTQDSNCLLDWRNYNNEGLLLYQDDDGSFVSNFGDSFLARSIPCIMQEGESYKVKAYWGEDFIGIKVNDEEDVIVEPGYLPLPSYDEAPGYIKVGHSSDLNSLCGDIHSIRIGK